MLASNTLLIFVVIIVVLIFIIIFYNSKVGFVGRRRLHYSYPMFNLGTREWYPTHLQSYDIRGNIPVAYYPVSVFNQPEWMARGLYPIFEPNFYTYEYVNPVQSFYPPVWNSNYSVPFKMDNSKTNSSNVVKPIVNTV